ncbi:MAG: hypothetical protein KY467_16725 [Gemmatimonadetes bacterium]|nr:hypothetical protein [Gemmatimonadota bacterium]
MKGLIKGLMTVALFAATAACDGSPTTASAFAPESDGIAMSSHTSSSLTFSYTQSNSTQDPQVASGSVGGIDFGGSLTTGTPCVNVSATHSTRRSTVTVTVTAVDNGNICMQVITHNNYTGRVNGLAAGTYTFNVVHDGGFNSGTAWTGTVTVQ